MDEFHPWTFVKISNNTICFNFRVCLMLVSHSPSSWDINTWTYFWDVLFGLMFIVLHLTSYGKLFYFSWMKFIHGCFGEHKHKKMLGAFGLDAGFTRILLETLLVWCLLLTCLALNLWFRFLLYSRKYVRKCRKTPLNIMEKCMNLVSKEKGLNPIIAIW